MNAILGLTLIATSGLAIAGLAILALTSAGIHREERRQSLPSDPRSRIDALARRVLGAHVSVCRVRRMPYDIWGDTPESHLSRGPQHRASRYSLH
jgi:hypothetical protein